MSPLRIVLSLGLLTILLHGSPLFADAPPGEGGPAGPAKGNFELFAASAAAPATEPGAPADFDFFSHQPTIVEAFQLDPAIEKRAARRRTLLSAHQASGLTTLALMAATTIVGQFNYNDLYGANAQFTGSYQTTHKTLAYGTTLGFATTASLAFFAPAPAQRRDGFDAVSVHKMAVSAASIGVISQIVLGITMANMMESGKLENRDSFGRAHQIIGYSSLGFMTIAATTYVW